MKETTDKLDFIKVKNSCSEKYNVKKMRKPATDGGVWELWKHKKLLFKKNKDCIKLPPQEKTNIQI